jgi:hypothetical protein
MPLFENQPSIYRQKIHVDVKKIPKAQEHLRRLFSFEPSVIYERIEESGNFDIYKRHFSVPMDILFPKIEGECSCGCGEKLTGRRTRWSSDVCYKFANAVFLIIAGHASSLRFYRKKIIGSIRCEICGSTHNIELDHIYPVKFGGGGGWLSNYMFKCKKCHVDKTNADFGFKQYKK